MLLLPWVSVYETQQARKWVAAKRFDADMKSRRMTAADVAALGATVIILGYCQWCADSLCIPSFEALASTRVAAQFTVAHHQDVIYCVGCSHLVILCPYVSRKRWRHSSDAAAKGASPEADVAASSFREALDLKKAYEE